MIVVNELEIMKKLVTLEEIKSDVEKFEKYLDENHQDIPRDIGELIFVADSLF